MKNIELIIQLIAVAVVSAAAFVSAIAVLIMQELTDLRVAAYCMFMLSVAALFALIVKFTIKELRR